MDEPPSDVLTWSPAAGAPLPIDVTAVRWPDGTVECRFRLLHSAGSLVASDDDVGVVLCNEAAVCTTCSEACGD